MSQSSDEKQSGVMYQCINCSAKLNIEQLSMTPEIKCPFCGYRVLKKMRPPVVKHVKAR